MKKNLLYSSLAFLLFAYACQKDVYYNIDPNTKMQFKQGDTLLFISALRTDTFKISELADGYDTSDKLYHREFLSANYQKLNYRKSEDSLFKDDSWYATQRSQTGTSIEWRNIYGGLGGEKEIDTILHIGNLTIDSVFVFNDSINKKHFPNDVKRVCYSHRYGILEYERYTGEIFLLDSKCFSKYIK